MSKEGLLQASCAMLEGGPFDVAHDLLHHKEVWENCRFIVENDDLKVDEIALKQAALWHDYERADEQKNHRILRQLGEQNMVDPEFVELVIGIISPHSFGKTQETVEQKVLFDADKIEYVNPDRFKRILEALEAGAFDHETWEQYKKVWVERTPQVRTQLHFESSTKRFDEYFARLRILIFSDQRLQELSATVL